MQRRWQGGGAAVIMAAAAGCASLGLGDVIRAPTFDVVSGRNAELRLLGPSADSPLGGAAVRIWARVGNPNPFGLTLASLAGTLFLESSRAATVDFPMGLPLTAGQDTIVPIDVRLRWSDIPELRDVALRALGRQPIAYRLDGTVGVEAGALGQPTFGPSTLMQGQLEVAR